MSVLIKGIEMPKACLECPLKVHLYQQLWCTPSNKVIDREDNTEREPDCPLIAVPTPHGRLTDADKLLEDHGLKLTEEFAPTVIEAEGSNI